MNKQLIHKLKYLIILIIVFIFLSPHTLVFADADVNNIKFKFTCYSDQETSYNALNSGLTHNDFTVNPKI